MILVIDNYDSFTFNIVHTLEELGAAVEVRQNDSITLEEIAQRKPSALLLSPGPGTPNEAGVTLAAVTAFAGKIPMLGVCLGHQAIGQAFGATVVRAPKLMHGKPSEVFHDGSSVFQGLPSPLSEVRYHSLTLEPETFPAALRVNARTRDGVIMALAHPGLPVYGVQFHPESWLSQHGHALFRNFLRLAGKTQTVGERKRA
jgi:anthranilate synthase/aminodeoxychorismate synthase-like glutamine amidotransferase